ncbi:MULTISPECIES: restriction endonuclease subunit S [Blautia]|uniref:restriction endonuclease subunit S n=1 Tax=Blautia TaxID=572511 RepID=UPI001D08C7CB|nr:MULTISPECIES: restriction endonuclease subunit S [Blautia]MCB6742193.1 restriction endonuclease subunit S [Blautia sp. 210820-DFI.6.14]MCB6958621.1 restriction endonuclease subunit S [Blautia obeum]
MRAKLEDVCVRGSSNLKQSDVIDKTGEYPIYGAAGYIGNVDFYHQDQPYVAVVKDGAGIGRTSLYPAESSVIGTMQYLLPKENVLPEYLCYVVKYMHLEKYFTGATIPHIYFKDYKKEEFNLDTLDRQKEIVNILGRIECVISSRQQELQKLDELIKARFVEMFGDLANPECSWDKSKLIDVCTDKDDIKCGPFGTQLNKDEYIESGIAVWEIPQINAAFLINPTHFLTEEKAEQLKAYTIIPGDIAMSRKGNVGKCALFPDNYPEGIIHSDVLRIRVDRKRINPLFMMCQLHFSGSVTRQIELVSSGAIMAGVNVTKLKQIYVHVPPIELQNQFADFVHQVDKSKVAVQKALEKTQLLFDSLMQQYFG